MYEAERETTSIAVAGDSLLTRRLRVFGEGRYLRLRGVLHRAGLRFANLESTGNAHLDATHAQHQGGGTCMTTQPALLTDLVWLGINLLACGSSYADEYGWRWVRPRSGSSGAWPRCPGATARTSNAATALG
jgi:hypothetical protein